MTTSCAYRHAHEHSSVWSSSHTPCFLFCFVSATMSANKRKKEVDSDEGDERGSHESHGSQKRHKKKKRKADKLEDEKTAVAIYEEPQSDDDADYRTENDSTDEDDEDGDDDFEAHKFSRKNLLALRSLPEINDDPGEVCVVCTYNRIEGLEDSRTMFHRNIFYHRRHCHALTKNARCWKLLKSSKNSPMLFIQGMKAFLKANPNYCPMCNTVIPMPYSVEAHLNFEHACWLKDGPSNTPAKFVVGAIVQGQQGRMTRAQARANVAHHLQKMTAVTTTATATTTTTIDPRRKGDGAKTKSAESCTSPVQASAVKQRNLFGRKLTHQQPVTSRPGTSRGCTCAQETISYRVCGACLHLIHEDGWSCHAYVCTARVLLERGQTLLEFVKLHRSFAHHCIGIYCTVNPPSQPVVEPAVRPVIGNNKSTSGSPAKLHVEVTPPMATPPLQAHEPSKDVVPAKPDEKETSPSPSSPEKAQSNGNDESTPNNSAELHVEVTPPMATPPLQDHEPSTDVVPTKPDKKKRSPSTPEKAQSDGNDEPTPKNSTELQVKVTPQVTKPTTDADPTEPDERKASTSTCEKAENAGNMQKTETVVLVKRSTRSSTRLTAASTGTDIDRKLSPQVRLEKWKVKGKRGKKEVVRETSEETAEKVREQAQRVEAAKNRAREKVSARLKRQVEETKGEENSQKDEEEEKKDDQMKAVQNKVEEPEKKQETAEEKKASDEEANPKEDEKQKVEDEFAETEEETNDVSKEWQSINPNVDRLVIDEGAKEVVVGGEGGGGDKSDPTKDEPEKTFTAEEQCESLREILTLVRSDAPDKQREIMDAYNRLLFAIRSKQ